MNQHKGLTLIELLIALAVGSIIAIGTFSLFNSSVNARNTLVAHSEEVSQLSRTMRVLEQDFIQHAPSRPVRDAYGEYSSALILNFDGLFLTRNGWSFSPFMTYERSTQQRVHYRLAEPGSELCELLEEDEQNDLGGCLIRSYQSHLDDDGSLKWHHQKLMRPIKHVNWQFLVLNPETSEMKFSDEPPVEDPRTGLFITRLMGIEITLESGNGMVHKRLFAMPSLPVIDDDEAAS